MTERDRLLFVLDRDGGLAAEKFAEQVLSVYVADSIKRGPHKESIEECIKFLEDDCGCEVTIVLVKAP